MASEEYTESEMAKIVKRLMDEEGFEFGEAVREAMEQTKNFESKADGGTIGIEVLFKPKRQNLFMGGPALTGAPLAIYNSMKAYDAFTDQEIADAIRKAGYDLPTETVSTSAAPSVPVPTAQANVGGDGGDGIYNTRATNFIPTGEGYTPAMFQNIKNKFSSGIQSLLNNPVTNLIGAALNPVVGVGKMALEGIGSLIPPNKRAAVESAAKNVGIQVDDIGRIVTNDRSTPEGIMAGYNLNKLTDKSFKDRIDTISGTLQGKYGLTEDEVTAVIEGTYKGKKGINPVTGKVTNLFQDIRNIKKSQKIIGDAKKAGLKTLEDERIAKEKKKEEERLRKEKQKKDAELKAKKLQEKLDKQGSGSGTTTKFKKTTTPYGGGKGGVQSGIKTKSKSYSKSYNPGAGGVVEHGGGGGQKGGGSGGGSGGYTGGGFCFDPNTLVQMADGTEKKIKEIQLGDNTKGGEVTGVFQFKAADEIHDYKGVTVAGSHYVKENGRFIMVQDSPLSVKIDKIPVVYSLDTTGRRIFINNIEFADYNGDGVAKNFLTNAGVDLTGFDTEVLRQVEQRLI